MPKTSSQKVDKSKVAPNRVKGTNKPQETNNGVLPKKRNATPETRKVIWPEIAINGVPIPEDSLKITVSWAKEALGWETEADLYNRERERDPKYSRAACDYGDDYLLIDEQSNKVRCRHNADNRPFTESWARKLCQDILNGHWKFNMENIIISRTGKILSGQHRLIALVLAGQMWAGKGKLFWSTKWPEEPYILSFVATGGSEDQDVINTLDLVKPRSFSDALYTSALFRDLNLTRKRRERVMRMIQSAVKFLWKRTIPTHNMSSEIYTTNSALTDFMDRHKRILDFVRYMFDLDTDNVLSNNVISPGQAAAICYLQASSESNPDDYLALESKHEGCLSWDNEKKARRFWEEIVKDTALFKPLRTGLAALTNPETGAKGREIERLCLLCKAWALFLQDMPISVEAILPDYDEDEDGNKHLSTESKRVTFGGIDFGEPFKEKKGKEEDEDDNLTPEQRAAAIREENRKKHEERLRKNRNSRGKDKQEEE